MTLNGCVMVSNVTIQIFASRCSTLKRLAIAGLLAVTGESVAQVAQNCRGLESLDIRDCYVDDSAVLQVANCCTGLKEIAITGTQECGKLRGNKQLPRCFRYKFGSFV